MRIRKILHCLLIATACLGLSLPGQAAMVGTAQMQNNSGGMEYAGIDVQRDWITEQLIKGGVEATDARLRVAAMTDGQVIQLHQRIDQEPAGGDVVIFLLVVLLITEMMGVTDIVPFIRPVE